MKTIALKLAYRTIDTLSIKGRLSFLIKLKLIIGIALLSGNALKAQSIQLENTKNVSDTLKIDIEMEESKEIRVLCYVTISVSDPDIRDMHREIRNENSIKSFFRGNMQEPEKYINSIISY